MFPHDPLQINEIQRKGDKVLDVLFVFELDINREFRYS